MSDGYLMGRRFYCRTDVWMQRGNLLNDFRDQFEIMAHPQNAGTARERIRAAAVRAGFSGLDLADIEIAFGEAVTNAILYGSPSVDSRIQVAFGAKAGGFFVEVRDHGQGFDPAQTASAEDVDALGGRGLRLMRALMDQVDLHYDGQGMLARLSKKLPA